MGRPKKEVDLAKLRNLAMIGCPYQVIAAECGISHDTLQRRYLPLVEEARGTGKRRVLAKAFQLAMKGNTRIVELLLVNWCGFTLRPETIISVTQNAAPPPPVLTPENKAMLLDFHQKLIERARQHNGQNDFERLG